MNTARCRHFFDFIHTHCAVEIALASVRDGMKVPCITEGYCAGGKPCTEASFPDDGEVDEYFLAVIRRAKEAHRAVVGSGTGAGA